MSGINQIGSYYPPIKTMAASQSSGSSSDVMSANNFSVTGKDEFLKLLVAQLQNQDPTSPVKNEDFVAQLATFSSLEKLISIDQNIKKLTGSAD
jgi:flagellar basal-body rod modification protein FlgD